MSPTNPAGPIVGTGVCCALTVEFALSGGTVVTFTGTGFSTTPGATVVRFGVVDATAVSCASTTTCTATSPAGAVGTVGLVVIVGGVASSSSTYTYN